MVVVGTVTRMSGLRRGGSYYERLSLFLYFVGTVFMTRHDHGIVSVIYSVLYIPTYIISLRLFFFSNIFFLYITFFFKKVFIYLHTNFEVESLLLLVVNYSRSGTEQDGWGTLACNLSGVIV